MDKYYSHSAVAFIVCCTLLPYCLFAQSAERLLLKPDILALFQHTPTLQLRTEYKIFPKNSLQFSSGFCYGTFYTVYQDPYSPEYDAVNLKGFTTKLEYRYYLQDSTNSMQGIYIAPEIAYKFVTYEQARFFNIVTPSYTYQKLLEYDVKKNTYAYHIKLGYQRKITKKVYFDVFSGIGRRIITLKNNIKLPDNADYIENTYFTQLFYWGYKGTKTRPSITASFLIGFMF